jgi:hypothetical protein
MPAILFANCATTSAQPEVRAVNITMPEASNAKTRPRSRKEKGELTSALMRMIGTLPSKAERRTQCQNKQARAAEGM